MSAEDTAHVEDAERVEDTEYIELIFGCDEMADVSWSVQEASFLEKLNEPYALTVELATSDVSAEPARFLGQSCFLDIIRGTASRRVTGIATEVVEGSTSGEVVTARVLVEPAFESLRHRINTRIFQDMSVPGILEDVLNRGLGKYHRSIELRLDRTYPTCAYRVQYDESDFAFCERLIEEEGIAYWFEFDGEAELLVLADAASKFGQVETIHESPVLFSLYEGDVGGHEYVREFHGRSQLVPTKLATRHFDWTHPSMPVEGESSPGEAGDRVSGALVDPEREVYEHDSKPLTFHEYGGLAFEAHDKDAQLQIRREDQAVEAFITEGESTVFGMTVAATFELVQHPQLDLNGSYLITEVNHVYGEQGHEYVNQFECQPQAVPYRPQRYTRKPQIPSVQTAIVVGPSGEEIHTDEHGRIKVQFHWDRLGARDEHSSCWLRVAQGWGGAGWGFVFIPRIGMEVIVAFVNGDPDQPLVIGSLYNGDNAPPYPLPDEKTKSTIKTRSSLGGDGYNELRFEDKAGEEEIFVHGQKDYNEVVENDHNTTVHHDQTNTVDNNQTELVKVDQSLTVEGNREKTVKGDETTTVEGARTETVTGDESVTLDSNRTVAVTSNDELTIKGDRKVEVKGSLEEAVKGDHKNQVKGARQEKVAGTYDIKAEKAFTLEDDKEITIKTGDSSITLKSDGTIEIKGKEVKITGGKSEATMNDDETTFDAPKVGIKGKDEVKVEGKKVELN